MKVSGGLLRITLNASARTKFFLIAPELARLATEAKFMAGLTTDSKEHHHDFSPPITTNENKAIHQLMQTIKSCTDPFSLGDNAGSNTDLYNLITKKTVCEKTKKDLVQQSEIGKKLFISFVEERVKSGKINLWAVMKKRKLQTWKSNGKVIKVKTAGRVEELKEDRSLFARLMMVCKSRPDIDIKEAIGLYEFTVVPRSLFASDGTMMHCSCKSTLMHILEKQSGESSTSSIGRSDVTVAIVDGMAEVQSLDKPDWIKTCNDLAEHFIARLFIKYNNTQQIRLIVDRYDVLSSLKSATQSKRQGTQEPIYYHITDSTHIAKVTLKKLISHTKTKAELTVFLA